MPDVREAGEEVVADRVLLHRRVHAERNRERSPSTIVAQNTAGSSATARGWIMLDTGSPVRLLVPRSPCRKPRQPVPPLHDDRVVEAERLALLRDQLAPSSVDAGTWRADRSRVADEPERDERRDEQHRNRSRAPVARDTSARGSRPSAGPATRGLATLLLDAPLIDVPEHALDRVVVDRTDDLLAPDQDVGRRVERQRNVVVGEDVVGLACGVLPRVVVEAGVDDRASTGRPRARSRSSSCCRSCRSSVVGMFFVHSTVHRPGDHR